MSVRIISDSSCDIFELKGFDFLTVPLTISTDEHDFIDDDKLDTNVLVDYLKTYKGRSFSACPSVQAWLDSYEGADEIYVVCMTGTLSGTYNSAILARDMYLEANPNAKIAVFNTLTTSCEQLLFIEHIAELINSGLSFEEISKEAPKYIENTNIFFAFRSIHNLAENGRVNKLVASTVGALGLSILGGATPEGTLITTGKCRGEKKTTISLYESLIKAGYCGGKIRITHVNNLEFANHFKEFVYTHFPMADIEIIKARGLIAFYAEEGGIIVACSTLEPTNSMQKSLLA